MGAELVPGDLCEPETLKSALEGVTAVIDAATARPTDSLGIKQIDWKGKVSLIQAARKQEWKNLSSFPFWMPRNIPKSPLLEIKRCTELFLAESGLNYTILKPCGFFQGLIGQYAIPILDKQAVLVPGLSSPVAYMDTIDIAKFAVKALSVAETENRSFPIVGSKAWTAEEIIRLCERLSGKEAKITRTPTQVLRLFRQVTRWFQWSWNVSDRLAFAEVLANGQPLQASMDETYQVFGIDPKEISSLETYMQEYFSRIMKKLKELEYEQEKLKKRKQRSNPFKPL